MSKNHINMDMVREARKNLAQIARDHPELTNLSGDDKSRLLEEVFEVAVDKSKLVFHLEEVAELLGVHKETVRRWILAGKLKSAKTGREHLISRADLQAFWKELGGDTLFDDNA
jgi:excisionase family DNA binding protein